MSRDVKLVNDHGCKFNFLQISLRTRTTLIICKFYIPSHCLFVGGDEERLCVSKTQNDRLIGSTVSLKFVDSAFFVFVARVF